MNTPELGKAHFEATLSQNGKPIPLATGATDSTTNTRATLSVTRGTGTGTATDGVLDWTPAPVDITVRMKGSRYDQKVGAMQSRLAWPLGLDEYAAAAPIAAKKWLDAQDKNSEIFGANIHATASGVRFAPGDGLGGAWDAFFTKWEAGQAADPDALPTSVPKTVRSFTGNFAPGATSFKDQSCCKLLSDWARFDLTNPPAPWISWISRNGITATVTDGIASFNLASEPWNLSEDPRAKGQVRLLADTVWDGAASQTWSLLSLYRSAWGTVPVSDSSKSLFRHLNSGWDRNPDLQGINLLNPAVAWRNGEDASRAFDIQGVVQGTEPLPSLQVQRKPGVWGLPEYFPVSGSVPNGKSYQLGIVRKTGGWETQDSGISTCAVSDKNCLLGYLDAARIPADAQIGLVVEGSPRKYQLQPYRTGKLVGSDSMTVASLYGEASVYFPPGAQTGKSLAERLISVRTLTPADAGLAYAGNLVATGPVVEITPSQSFGTEQSQQPYVSIQLHREDLGSKDPASLSLYKVDPTLGTLVPLTTQLSFQDEARKQVDATGRWETVTLSAPTPTFSMFAVLAKGKRDSRLWNLTATPIVSQDSVRIVTVTGIGYEELDWYLGRSPVLKDPKDPAEPFGWGTDDEGRHIVKVPTGVHWLFALPKDGGLAKSIRLERTAESFQFRSLAGKRTVVGTANGRLRLPFATNHAGRLTVGIGSGAMTGFVHDTILPPSGRLDLDGTVLGYGFSDSLTTRLSAQDASGAVIDTAGPLLVGDPGLPRVGLVTSVRRTGSAWTLKASVQAGDDESGIDTVRLQAWSMSGRLLGQVVAAEQAVDLALMLSEDTLPDARIRWVAQAVDRGGNHQERSEDVDFEWLSAHSVWWTSAREQAPRKAWFPVCELPGRWAVQTDSVTTLNWPMPSVQAAFRLAGRWRSADTATVTVLRGAQALARFTLPARPVWKDVEMLDSTWSVDVQAGDTLTLAFPKGMQWEGFALVDAPERLVGWKAPVMEGQGLAQVWVRDEDPSDANMSHPRYYVANPGIKTLDGYQLRYRVRTEAGKAPVFEDWWPVPVSWSWQTDGQGLWDVVLDRHAVTLAPGALDFTKDGLSTGIHYLPWAPWNRLDDPSYQAGTVQSRFLLTDRIPAFDTAGTLVSPWTCVEPVPWVSKPNQSENGTPGGSGSVGVAVPLHSNAPAVMEGTGAHYTVAADGNWNWNTTYLGISSLDGQALDGVTLTLNGATQVLTGWYQQLSVPNEAHQPLDVQITAPVSRKLQIQKWEN